VHKMFETILLSVFACSGPDDRCASLIRQAVHGDVATLRFTY
jgi:hypothetical protein